MPGPAQVFADGVMSPSPEVVRDVGWVQDSLALSTNTADPIINDYHLETVGAALTWVCCAYSLGVASVAAEGCYKGKQLLYLSSSASSFEIWLPQTHPSPSHQKCPRLGQRLVLDLSALVKATSNTMTLKAPHFEDTGQQ